MKRALAERVKQELSSSAAASNDRTPLSIFKRTNSNGELSFPPEKIARFDSGHQSIQQSNGMLPPSATADTVDLAVRQTHEIDSGSHFRGEAAAVLSSRGGAEVSHNMMTIPRRIPPHSMFSTVPPSSTTSILPSTVLHLTATNSKSDSCSAQLLLSQSTNSKSDNIGEFTPSTLNEKSTFSPNAHSSGNVIAFQSSASHRNSQSDGEEEDEGGSTTAATTPAPTNSAMSNGVAMEPTDTTVSEGRGKKRPGRPRKLMNATNTSRNSHNSDSEEEMDPSSGPFYLKHQNLALSSELYAYRRRIYLLEREREYRRKECRVALKNVRELEGIWKGLEDGLVEDLVKLKNQSNSHGKNGKNGPIDLDVPPVSTGFGTDVETVPFLLSALNDLANNDYSSVTLSEEKNDENTDLHVNSLNIFENYSDGTIKEKDDESIIDEKRYFNETKVFSAAVTSRAKYLRDRILEILLRRASSTVETEHPATSTSFPMSEIIVLREQLLQLELKVKDANLKMDEIAKARNEAVASERRVRRGLYRLASGRMTLEDVLKAVEKEDSGASFIEAIASIEGLNFKSTSSPDGTPGVISSSDVMSSPSFSAVAGTSKDISCGTAYSEEITMLKKSLLDVQAVAETREKKIVELLNEREELGRRINCLLLSKKSDSSENDDVVRKSVTFNEIAIKLQNSERRVYELEIESEDIRKRWAVTKGDLETTKRTMADIEGKHERRWNELISQFSLPQAASNEVSNDEKDTFGYEKKIVELENKLQQSSESVNRVETLRATLSDAYRMNETLQSKLDDLKSKNAKMIAEKSAARAAQGSESVTSPQGSSTKKPSISSSNSSGDLALEKLQRDYKRARKEIAAAILSKDQAKLKQERAEKERDALMKTNARLLKQSSEKDEMNAKSLSTILLLKQRNEELVKENSILNQKTQAAQQLSLAARLASNAKDRLGEEALKEKEMVEECTKKLREECSSLRDEMVRTNCLLNQSKQEVKCVTKDLDAISERCNELVMESTKKEVEMKQMIESFAIVKKESMESAKKAVAAPSNLVSNGRVRSEFTLEQLTTQVKYLSDRMNCPVCNTREKKCILLRCRHMFCRNCVDENVKNRSRKCPACAQRFDTKDVADIWL